MYSCCFVAVVVLLTLGDAFKLDSIDDYDEFLNFGQKKSTKLNQESLENAIFKSKVDILGEIFKKNIDGLKADGKLDLVFLIDASSSVGESNFRSELKFVKKLLSDVAVDYDHTRVAVVTFSSAVTANIDEISIPRKENNKCLLLNKQLNSIKYSGGGTYTLGAFKAAQDIFQNSRNDSRKVLFLITDGFSNGGDPVPLANELKEAHISIFTVGIRNGNYKELYELATSPGEFHSYLLDSFQEFESLARRALHVDLKTGDYIPLGIDSPCNSLCEDGNCCDKNAVCTCGTSTGHYSCVCQPGFYGSGLRNSCVPCPIGSYSDGPNLCLPCPDMHHTTKVPAHSIESCKCKIGYQPTKDHQCEILKCPKMTIPEHGYFVKKRDCGNVLNSACGIRCEVGYTLVGSSIRLCQVNGTWSGEEPSCQIKTCAKLAPPPSGSMTCYHTDLNITYNETEQSLPVDTVCTFKCEAGKTLIGSHQRTCLPLARWDGLKTSCKQIKCPKLASVSNGNIEPISCTVGKQPYGKKCNITCHSGFQIEGPPVKTCTGNHGLWDSKFESTVCKDVTPPVILCPLNITVSTQLGKKFGFVSWNHPEVADNSDLEVSVWMKPSIKNITSFKFQIGKTEVAYFAQDAFHNKAKCTFFVTVTDDERPVIEDCVSPPTFLTNDVKGANVSWEEPDIFDNSRHVEVTKSHQFGFFPLGTTTVTYSAVDKSGNKNICAINITVEDAHCEALPDPIFGHSECSSRNDSMQCVITCQEGYAVPLTQPQNSDNNSVVSFLCNESESVWYNQEGLVFPECSITEVPKEIERTGVVSVLSDLENCHDSDRFKDLENDIKITLQETSCEDNCTVKTNTTCEDEEEEAEERTNIIKRDVAFEEVTHQNDTKRRGKKRRVNVKFQVRSKYLNESQELGNLDIYGPHNMSIRYEKTRFICSLGFVPRKKRCVQCSKGTFHNVTTNKCQSCGFGHYNDLLGQTECPRCPVHFSTRKLHSRKRENCKEQCSPGTHARKKVMKQSRRHPDVLIERPTLKPYCRSCNFGYYQPEYNQMRCLPCPRGYTTLSLGAASISQCVPTAEYICENTLTLCNKGKCVAENDYQYNCICPDNYIGSHCEKLMTPCDSSPCQNGGTCKFSNSSHFECLCPNGYSGHFCQYRDEKCILICLNGGTCLHNDANDYFCLCPSSYGGDTCEIEITYCTQGICENNSTCLEETNGFRCTCPQGFFGKRCTILPCDYRPCPGNSICVNNMEANATKNSYKCVCPEGYQGLLCDQKVDYCANAPCLNGATCINHDTTFSCDCPKLFHGNLCQLRRSCDYILNFQKFSTSDYIKLKGFDHNISEITACLWLQTKDSFNYGTLLSYATKEFDNAFTLTDYTGLVFYINNQYAVTDVLLNDGLWHHVCVTWENSKGSYKLYVDGALTKNGSGLAPNMKVAGRGNMVIGQEQDVLGGRFSQSETFIGKIAYTDVWSKELSTEEVLTHMNDCQDSFFGDIYAWPEIQENVEGNIQIEKSSFCTKCEEPKPMYNGFIKVIDNVAYYECYKGFLLSGNMYHKGRKCTKAGKWEGLYEPYCKRVYCGYPGFVRNAYTIGSKYYFHDQVKYQCYEGYMLVGNSTAICTERGAWYPDKPKCAGLQCIAFKKPDNSNLTVIAEYSYEDFIENQSTFDPGTQIEITCDEDAVLTGENVVTCQENGTWDMEPPQCVLSIPETTTTSTPKKDVACDINKIPAPPINGYTDLESFYAVSNKTDDVVKYKCRVGYVLHGDNFTMCIIDGYWTEPNVSCDPILCPAPQFTNMIIKEKVTDDTYAFGNMIKLECIDGYRMFGDSSVRCLASGRWTKMKGKCTRKSCRKPLVKDTTIVEGNSYLYEDQVTLLCPSMSRYILTCNSFGMWVGEKDETC